MTILLINKYIYSMIILFSANSFEHLYKLRIKILKNFQKQGFEVYAVAKDDEFKTKITELGIKVITININPHSKNFLKDIGLLVCYYKIFKKIKPDILYNSTIKPNIYGSMVSGLLKIKTINNISGLGTGFLKSKLLKRLIIILYRFSNKNVYKIYFQNKEDMIFFEKEKISKKNQSTLIPGSGVDTNFFKRKTEFSPNKKTNFIFIGRILKEKGILELISAFNKFQKNNPSKLTIIGSYDPENPSSVNIKKFIDDVDLDQSIKYLGVKKNIIDYLENSDCLILPSYREGLSNVLLEAMSMKLPVLASNVPGCKDLIINNNGFLFEPKSVESIYNALKKFASLSKREIIDMGKNGRELVEKKYDVRLLLKIYQNDII